MFEGTSELQVYLLKIENVAKVIVYWNFTKIVQNNFGGIEN